MFCPFLIYTLALSPGCCHCVFTALISPAPLPAPLATSPPYDSPQVTRQFLQDQELLRLQVLDHIASVGQASEGPGQVCRWLTDVLTMFAGDTVPVDEEATRFILSFASSLHDPGLGVAPSIAAMPSLTTLVPHYDVSWQGLLQVQLGLQLCML